MRRIDHIIYPLLLVVLTACTSIPKQPLSTSIVIQVTSISIKPLIHGWGLDDNPLVSQGNFSMGILGFQLSNTATSVFYSLTDGDSEQIVKERSVEIIDDLGRSYRLVQVVPFPKVEELELGVLEFEPRFLYSGELYLQIAATEDAPGIGKSLVLKFDGHPSEDRLYSTYFGRREEAIDHGGYRIGMGFGLIGNEEFDRSSKISETIEPILVVSPSSVQDIQIPWITLPEGVFVDREYSFTIESIKSRRDYFVNVQLLSDGNVISNFNQSVSMSTPIPVMTLTPTFLPYPAPSEFEVPPPPLPYPAP